MMNSYLNDRKAIDRLKREYLEHKNLIVGFDFNNTIFDYHKEGLESQPVIDLLKKCSDLGFTMCLYTIGDRILFKQDYVECLGIRVDYTNESPIMQKHSDMYYYKPYFNILLDDRAGLGQAFYVLKTTLIELGLYER